MSSALNDVQRELFELDAERGREVQASVRPSTLESELMAFVAPRFSGDSVFQLVWCGAGQFCCKSVCRDAATAGAEVTQFIHLFRKYKSESYRPAPQLQTFAAWQEYLSNGPCAGSNFEHHDIAPEFDLQQPLFVSIRKDLFQGLLDMISNGTEQPVLFPSEIRDPLTKERMYSEQYTGITGSGSRSFTFILSVTS